MSSLRIGYVNVRGLSAGSWDTCCSLIEAAVDYLFVAETWFVGHERRRRDRMLIASTPKPPPNTMGRLRGGIYLLGTRDARSKARDVIATEHTLTFTCDQRVYTGVYLPPTSLTSAEVGSILDGVRTSTVVLGDVNVRFKDPVNQSGPPGPPERLQLFQDFLSRTGHVHIKPATKQHGRRAMRAKLTTDHAFVARGVESELRLLDNRSLGMDTDHEYTMVVAIADGKSKAALEPTIRFRTSQLRQPRILEEVVEAADRVEDAPVGDVEALSAYVIKVCQEIAESKLGRTRARGTRASTMQTSEMQTYAASVRLYKEASRGSRENEVVVPTERAQSQGMDAMTENLQIFEERYRGRECPSVPSHDDVGCRDDFLSLDKIKEEIDRQEAEKACGIDGIHIRFLKAVRDTGIVRLLQRLYKQCVSDRTTPRSWNRSEIHLLSKDKARVRDADNLRPISLICMFRKIFERLLLLECEGAEWARLHHAQAGFRREYSTYTNAAVVHALLASKARTTAVFLDFRAAFDMVDHQILLEKLRKRGCHPLVVSLIYSLMCAGVSSRLFINGKVSQWFERTRGVLQGSPLSPWLFNIFVDDLLEEINGRAGRDAPLCLFYADDGALVMPSSVDAQALLDVVQNWTAANRLELRVGKCGYISSRLCPPRLFLNGEELELRPSYEYLGFPMTARGIDFAALLRDRVTAAIGRANWLGTQSDSWGVAHRLRIYKQFLAPMFEYGAPLVWAWVRESMENRKAFELSVAGIKELMGWISHSSSGRHNVTMNLCGLLPVEDRFQQLSTAYQAVLDQMPRSNPLKGLLQRLSIGPFLRNLTDDTLFAKFKQVSSFEPTLKKALARFLRQRHRTKIHEISQSADLTKLIPMETRRVPGLFMADVSLSATLKRQDMLFQYRRGVFMFNSTCACDPGVKFHRGHESCQALKPQSLTHKERQQKWKMKSELRLERQKFTDIDFLLNVKKVETAATILMQIQSELRQVYKKTVAGEISD